MRSALALAALLALLTVDSGTLARERQVPVRPFWLQGYRPPGKVSRLVSLAPNLTEMVFALGLGQLVVGVTRYDDYPPEVKNLPRVGGFVDPSVEGIVALEPDLVLCTPNPGGRQRLEVLVRTGIAVLVLPSYDLQGIYRSLRFLGQVLERPQRAEGLVRQLREHLEKVAQRVAGRRRPRVLMLYGRRPLVAAGPGSFADELITLAGGRNVVSGGSRYPVLPLEQVVVLAPEVIIDASMAPGEESDANLSRLRVVPAVRQGRVHRFDSALWFRPGPRIAAGLEKLARLLHPEAFAEASRPGGAER